MVPADVASGDATVPDDDYNLFMIQLSSIRLFESGVRIACLIILSNWFPGPFRGLFVSIWYGSYHFIPIILFFVGDSSAEHYVWLTKLTL